MVLSILSTSVSYSIDPVCTMVLSILNTSVACSIGPVGTMVLSILSTNVGPARTIVWTIISHWSMYVFPTLVMSTPMPVATQL